MEIGARTTGGLVKIYVTTGGTNYTSPPTVTITGGNGATAQAHIAGKRVESVAIVSAGTGFTGTPTIAFSGGGGTGAAATAYAYTGALRPISFFKGRFSDLYGVDGMGRGFRWNGSDAAVERIGLHKPAAGPAVTQSTSAVVGHISRIQLVQGGAGYHAPPTVTLTGGSPSTPATARALISNGRVSSIIVTNRGVGYQSPPSVSFSGGIGTGAAFTVNVSGRVSGVLVSASGTGYTTSPSVTGTVATTSNTITAFTAGINSGTVTFQNAAASTFARVSAGTRNVTMAFVAGTDTQFTVAVTTFPASGAATLYSGGELSSPYHGMLAGSTFRFSSISGGAGLTTGVDYYVVSAGANTFTAGTAVSGHTAIFTSDITGGVITIPPPRVEFGTGQGLSGAVARADIDAFGRISDVRVLFGGTGATTTGLTASIVGGGGTGASLSPQLTYSVSSVSVATAGSGYFTPPVITFRAATNDPFGSGAAVTSLVNTTGNLTGTSLVSGGEYSQPPTAIILDTTAKAQATVSQALQGKYQCAIRYIDDTPLTARGPIPSSISDLVEIDIPTPSESLTWTLTHYGVDDRVAAVELWRSTTDQSVSLFRVATIKRSDPNWSGTYVDTFSDLDLIDTDRDGFGVMPIVLPSGQLNARRFGVPPGEFAVATMFQDRAWYAVDTSGEKPNSLYYSETDEPESVPRENEIVVQDNTLEPDVIVGLIPFGTQLLIGQTSRLHALSYVSQPVLDASIMLVAYRGMLNSRCGDVLTGVAVIADSVGMYAFDGNNAEAISVPVDDYWRDNIIDFSKAAKFHVRCDSSTMTARFFYCRSTDQEPIRALCYCFATKAWWEETYATPVTATCATVIAQKTAILYAGSDGTLRKQSGLTDSGTAIPYKMRTGNLTLSTERGDRSVAFIYRPTTANSTLAVGLHFNNSPTARPNAIATDTGTGFTTVQGSTVAQLNMNKSRSSLGDANGFAQAPYSGRVDDRSAGGDKHVAVDVGGEQGADSVSLFAMRVAGAE